MPMKYWKSSHDVCHVKFAHINLTECSETIDIGGRAYTLEKFRWLTYTNG